jgi:16S rRNA (guanine527-N7)-methyltransferase
MASHDPTPASVAEAALALGRELSPEQASGLSTYLGLLQTWNRKTNLVGPRQWPLMLSELVADSWHLADLLSTLALPEAPLTLDFGAGAGIPGIPLRLFWGAGRYVLIEPRAKRAAFLRQCAAMMRLAASEVFEGRAEVVSEAVTGGAQVCLSRAFQPWREFLKTASGFRPDSGSGSGAGRYPLVVVFASDAAPDGDVPEGFALEKSVSYPSRGQTGYFWVFAPIS